MTGKITTIRQAKVTDQVFSSIWPLSCLGRATAVSQMTFQATSNISRGSMRSGWRRPRRATSDRAPSMHWTTPCISFQEPWSWMMPGQTWTPRAKAIRA